jgi:FkbM family methyltransferase
MIDRSFSVRLPRKWWVPVARPTGGRFDHAVFWALFVASLPFAVMGYYRFAWFRVTGRIAETFTKLGVHEVPAVALRSTGNLEFQLLDRYWSRLMFRTYNYEPEIDQLLQLAGSEIDLFIDGGANIGLWSVSASRTCKEVIAIEASPSVRQILDQNQARHHGSFSVVPQALWSSVGENLSFSFSTHQHAGSALTDVLAHDATKDDWTSVSVETTTLDHVGRHKLIDGSLGVIVVKIDVEGAELEVLRGASELLASNRSIFIYEEHGRSDKHDPTEYLLSIGLSITRLDTHGLQHIQNTHDVLAVTTQRWMGYNFLAFRTGGRAEEVVNRLRPLR